MLALATVGFAVNFWAWALLSPLGPLFRTTGVLGALSESEVALLVAADAFGREAGELAEFAIEYDPHPPFRTGTVDAASSQMRDAARGMIGPIIAQYRR